MYSTWGVPSTEERFKAMHSEIIMYFRCIEHDMKRIYSGMSADDYYDCMGERYPVKQMRMAKALSRLDFLKGKKDERSNIQQKER